MDVTTVALLDCCTLTIPGIFFVGPLDDDETTTSPTTLLWQGFPMSWHRKTCIIPFFAFWSGPSAFRSGV